MTASSILLTESSQDWSASYRFDNKRGVTSVYTLPGQAELADFRKGLRGSDFRSGPQVIDTRPTYTRGGGLTPPRFHNEHRSGATNEDRRSRRPPITPEQDAQNDAYDARTAYDKVLAWVRAPENVIGRGPPQVVAEEPFAGQHSLHVDEETSTFLSDPSAIRLDAKVDNGDYHHNDRDENDTASYGNYSLGDGDEDDYGEIDDDGDNDDDSSPLVPEVIDLTDYQHVEPSADKISQSQPPGFPAPQPSVGQRTSVHQPPALITSPAQGSSQQIEQEPPSRKSFAIEESDPSLGEEEESNVWTASDIDTPIQLPVGHVELVPGVSTGINIEEEHTRGKQTKAPRPSILRTPSYACPDSLNFAESVSDGEEPRGGRLKMPRPSILRNPSSVFLGGMSIPKSVAEGGGEETKKVTFGQDIALDTPPSQEASGKIPGAKTDPSDLSTDASSSEYEGSVPITQSVPLGSSPQAPKAGRAPTAVSNEARPGYESLSRKTPVSMRGQRHDPEHSIKKGETSSQTSQTSSKGSKAKRRNRERQQRPSFSSQATRPARHPPHQNLTTTDDRPMPPYARKPSVLPESEAPANLPPEAFAQPIKIGAVIFDCVKRQFAEGFYYQSGVVMPLLPSIEITSLGCSKVTRALRGCRDSTVYKDLRRIIWRFHLDLEDLNKRRQAHWLPLVENCIALVQRMIDDLDRAYNFRDRWDRKRYGRMLGDPEGREPGTIFYMFASSIRTMETGISYAQEARSALQTISLRSNEQIQATLTEDPIAIDMSERHARVVASIDHIQWYFTTLADCTRKVRDTFLVSMSQIVQVEALKLLTKADNANGRKLKDAAIRSDLTAWLDTLLRECLRNWELLPSKSAYEDSLKCFRNFDRVWEEECPNFGLLRSMFCLGIFLPRNQRTKLVGWHFVDNDDPIIGSNPDLVNDKIGKSRKSSEKQADANKRCVPIRSMQACARSSLYRILEIFASKEDEDDADSVDRLDQYLRQHTRELERPRQESSESYSPAPTEIVDNDRLLEEERLASRLQVELNKSFDLNSAKILVGVISEESYRKVLLNMTEQRLHLWVRQSSPPSAAALDLLSPLPPRPRPDLAGSIEDKEWEALRDYVYFLNTKIVHVEQLWQTYVEALLIFGWHELAREAEHAYEAIYGGTLSR